MKKYALVIDDLIQLGGQERLFEAIAEYYPEATIYTSIASSHWIDKLGKDRLRLSFLQSLPNALNLSKVFAVLGLYNVAFGLFDFKEYDYVLSVSSRFSHLINTQPNTKNIVYINSPARFLWDTKNYITNGLVRRILAPAFMLLRIMDLFYMKKANLLISNSANIERKVSKLYRRYSEVLHPFKSEIPQFKPIFRTTEYYVIVTRIVPWKKIDIAIKAFNENGKKLYIVGDGEEGYIADLRFNSNENIEFLGRVSEGRKFELLSGATAFIMTQREDFGISALEALSVGTPVVAYGEGGALETVADGISGIFYYEQTPKSLNKALEVLKTLTLDPEVIQKTTSKFTRQGFLDNLSNLISNAI